MKIYNRTDFMKLPAGTLFAKGKPQYFGSLSVKGDTWPNDFLDRPLMWYESHGDTGDEFDISYRFNAMVEEGASFPINESYGRDGCFDDEDLFLVYEPDDLKALQDVIAKALEVA